ncbi:MAG: carboxypeptidase-like regulatory domain-containing protein [Burkholderiales bacterium]
MASHFERDLAHEFAAGARGTEQQIEGMVEQARAIGMTTGLDLIAFFERLPASLVRAQELELERMARTGGEAHPRMAEAREALERSRQVAASASSVDARLKRAVVAQFAADWLLHGFVSDADGRPLAGYAVALSAPRLPEPLVAATEEDGYFRIAIERSDADVLEAAARDDREGASTRGQIEVLAPDRKRVVHRDPLPVAVGSGRLAVRDYVIDLAQ